MNIIRKIQAMKKRILIISVIVFAALVLLVAGGLAIFIATFDLADHRDRIEAEASRALGRNVELNGELSLEIGLHPEIVISDVRAPNADWAHDPLMLRLGRMEARVALVPLLFKTVKVERFLLSDLFVSVEMDEERGVNLVPHKGGCHGGSASDGRLELHDVVIENAEIHLRSPDRPPIKLVIDNAGAVFVPEAPMTVSAAGALNDLPFDLSIEGGDPEALMKGASDWPIDMSLTALESTLRIDGTLGADPAADLALELKVQAVEKLVELAGSEAQVGGPLAITADIRAQDTKLRIENIRITAFGNVLGGGISIEQRKTKPSIEIVLAADRLDLTPFLAEKPKEDVVSAKPAESSPVFFALPDYFTVSVIANVDRIDGLPMALTDLELEAGLANGAASLDALSVTMPGGTVTIIGRLEAKDGRAYANAAVQSDRFDLTAMSPASAGDAEPADKAEKPDRLIPDTPLDLDVLKSADADMTLRISKLIGGFGTIDDLAADVTLYDGVLTARPVTMTLADGTIDLEMILDAQTGGIASYDLAADVEGFDYGKFLAQNDNEEMMEGTVDLTLKLAGRGRTPRGFAETAGGRIEIKAGAGKIASSYVDLIAADFLTAMLPALAGVKEATTLNCMVARFDVEDGIATVDGMLFDTGMVTVAGTGGIDLGAEKLDLVVKPRPKNPSLLSMATDVRLGGTFANPSVRPTTASLVKGVGSLLLGTVNPLALVIPVVSIGQSDKNPCVAALENPLPQSTEEVEPIADPVATLKDAAKDIKGAADQFKDEIKDAPEKLLKGLFGR